MTKKNSYLRILYVEDEDHPDSEPLQAALSLDPKADQIYVTADKNDFENQIERHSDYDLFVLDYDLSRWGDDNAFKIYIRLLLKGVPEWRVLVYSAYAPVHLADQTTKNETVVARVRDAKTQQEFEYSIEGLPELLQNELWNAYSKEGAPAAASYLREHLGVQTELDTEQAQREAKSREDRLRQQLKELKDFGLNPHSAKKSDEDGGLEKWGAKIRIRSDDTQYSEKRFLLEQDYMYLRRMALVRIADAREQMEENPPSDHAWDRGELNAWLDELESIFSVQSLPHGTTKQFLHPILRPFDNKGKYAQDNWNTLSGKGYDPKRVFLGCKLILNACRNWVMHNQGINEDIFKEMSTVAAVLLIAMRAVMETESIRWDQKEPLKGERMIEFWFQPTTGRWRPVEDADKVSTNFQNYLKEKRKQDERKQGKRKPSGQDPLDDAKHFLKSANPERILQQVGQDEAGKVYWDPGQDLRARFIGVLYFSKYCMDDEQHTSCGIKNDGTFEMKVDGLKERFNQAQHAPDDWFSQHVFIPWVTKYSK